MANVAVIHNVETAIGDWTLCFQFCRYNYDNGEWEEGYRFIPRRPDGSLQPARGQARIPSLRILRLLIDLAIAAGWGHDD